MANINEVLAKAYELHGGIKSLLRLALVKPLRCPCAYGDDCFFLHAIASYS